MRSSETYSGYFNCLPREKQHIIWQYQAVGGALDELWKEICLRTETALWKQDGVGSCDADRFFSEEGLALVIRLEIVRLKELRSREYPGYNYQAVCPYHRPMIGCIAGDLRGPKCFNFVDPGLHKEMEERFGIHLLPIKPVLMRISLGGRDPRDLSLHPGINDELVAAYVTGIKAVICHIKGFPVIYEPQLLTRELSR